MRKNKRFSKSGSQLQAVLKGQSVEAQNWNYAAKTVYGLLPLRGSWGPRTAAKIQRGSLNLQTRIQRHVI